ncbi:hypothetical protein GF319_08865 [Candidatus Bathyarchaeota archaeon]|nr:hypothetical protein [Candidatus Bathyarchaeota archaeon]
MSLEQSSHEKEIEGKNIHASFIEFSNAVLAFIWEGDNPRLGTTTITLPDKTSSQVIGERDVITSKIIGERLAVKYNKLALVSTNLPKDFLLDQQLFALVDKFTGDKDE